MKKNAIVFTANTMHVAQANLMIESLFDPERGNFQGDLWVISTHLSDRCKRFLDSRGIKYLINPLGSFQDWKYRREIARSQPEFIRRQLNEDDAFLLYRNKRMSKLIICDWVNKFGENYDAIALCDNDLYFQRDVNALFEKTAHVDPEVLWYWQEENKNLPGTNLWIKNFHYTRLHDVDGMDFGEHEINIGFVISTPKLMRQVFQGVSDLFSSCNIELFRDCRWHDQDLVRVIRAKEPQLFRLFEEGDLLHLCNGGETLVEERSPQEFYHKKTDEKPYIVHFAGGAWKPFHSIAASYKADDGIYFFMEENDERFDEIRRNTDYDPFDAISHLYSENNARTKALARKRWQGVTENNDKKRALLFSWLDTGSHQSVKKMIPEVLHDETFNLAVIDGNVSRRDHSDISAEDLPDALARVTQTVKDKEFGRVFGYKRSDVPEEAIKGAIVALTKEYKCSDRNARAVANAAYIYLSKALAFYKPDVVFGWAAFSLSPRILKVLCKERGIPFVTLELGVLPETLAIDALGHMGQSWVAQRSAEFKELALDNDDIKYGQGYLARVREELPSRNIRVELSPRTERQLQSLKDSGKKIVVYIGSNCACSGNVPYDETAKKFHSPFFEDNDDVVRSLSEAFEDEPNVHVIYKPHPITITRGLDLSEDYKNITVLQDVNLDDCLIMADLALAKVSQGNYEALLRDIPVLMLGRNQLNGSGALYELSSREALKAEVLAALETGLTNAQKAAFEDHVARLLKYYLYAVSGKEAGRPQTQVMADVAALLEQAAPAYLATEQKALQAYRKPEEVTGDAPAISIIMPVFNGEDYLVDCIGSLLSQTYGDFELLCVNNGSTDGSQKILDYFASIDSRVKPLYQEEPNQRSARNLGVNNARGTYIHFFDCDDLFVPTAYEELMPVMEKTGADVLYFFFDEMYNTQKIGSPRHQAYKPYLPQDELFQMEEKHKRLFSQYPFPWAKLFKADFFREKDLYFDLDCANFDDNPQNLRTLLSTDNIFVLNKPFYKFRINDNSMTQSVNPRVFGMVDAVRIMNEIYCEFGRYDEFQKYYVPYKLHLVYFAWSKLPEDLKRDFLAEIPALFLPGDEAFFELDETASLFSYMSKGKIEFTRSALRGEWPDTAAKWSITQEPAPKPAKGRHIYGNPFEEKIIKKIASNMRKSSPGLFRVGKRVYRTFRPLPQ